MILVSAGHHLKAQGAQYQGHTEWEEASLWRDLVVQEIGQHRCHAVPSGTLREKVSFINARDPWMAVEIHFNSAINGAGEHVGKGYETLYYPGSVKGKIIAEYVQRGLGWALQTKDRGVKEGWYRQDAPGRIDYHGDVDGDEKIAYFLSASKCPSIIIEPEFIHRQHFIKRMRGPACEAIADALLDASSKLDLL